MSFFFHLDKKTLKRLPHISGSHDSSVGIVTRLRYERPNNAGLITGQGKRSSFPAQPQPPDGICSRPSSCSGDIGVSLLTYLITYLLHGAESFLRS